MSSRASRYYRYRNTGDARIGGPLASGGRLQVALEPAREADRDRTHHLELSLQDAITLRDSLDWWIRNDGDGRVAPTQNVRRREG